MSELVVGVTPGNSFVVSTGWPIDATGYHSWLVRVRVRDFFGGWGWTGGLRHLYVLCICGRAVASVPPSARGGLL